MLTTNLHFILNICCSKCTSGCLHITLKCKTIWVTIGNVIKVKYGILSTFWGTPCKYIIYKRLFLDWNGNELFALALFALLFGVNRGSSIIICNTRNARTLLDCPFRCELHFPPSSESPTRSDFWYIHTADPSFFFFFQMLMTSRAESLKLGHAIQPVVFGESSLILEIVVSHPHAHTPPPPPFASCLLCALSNRHRCSSCLTQGHRPPFPPPQSPPCMRTACTCPSNSPSLSLTLSPSPPFFFFLAFPLLPDHSQPIFDATFQSLDCVTPGCRVCL